MLNPKLQGLVVAHPGPLRVQQREGLIMKHVTKLALVVLASECVY